MICIECGALFHGHGTRCDRCDLRQRQDQLTTKFLNPDQGPSRTDLLLRETRNLLFAVIVFALCVGVEAVLSLTRVYTMPITGLLALEPDVRERIPTFILLAAAVSMLFAFCAAFFRSRMASLVMLAYAGALIWLSVPYLSAYRHVVPYAAAGIAAERLLLLICALQSLVATVRLKNL